MHRLPAIQSTGPSRREVSRRVGTWRQHAVAYRVNCNRMVPTECTLWTTAADEAAALWNRQLANPLQPDFKVLASQELCPRAGSSDPDIIVRRRNADPGDCGAVTMQEGESWARHTVGCTPVAYNRVALSTMQVNVKFADGCHYSLRDVTTNEWSAGDYQIESALMIMTHEFGHVLGVAHRGRVPDGPEGFPPPPPTPSPTPSGTHMTWPVMVDPVATPPRPYTGYHQTPIDPDCQADGVLDTVRCVLYRY